MRCKYAANLATASLGRIPPPGLVMQEGRLLKSIRDENQSIHLQNRHISYICKDILLFCSGTKFCVVVNSQKFIQWNKSPKGRPLNVCSFCVCRTFISYGAYM